jgi:integrase
MIVHSILANREPNAKVFSFDEDGFRYPWRRIAKAAGVKLFHSFRRTAARGQAGRGRRYVGYYGSAGLGIRRNVQALCNHDSSGQTGEFAEAGTV